MIKNIPNKYSLESLIEDFNLNFENKFDFINLPIDIKVTIYNLELMQCRICIS